MKKTRRFAAIAAAAMMTAALAVPMMSMTAFAEDPTTTEATTEPIVTSGATGRVEITAAKDAQGHDSSLKLFQIFKVSKSGDMTVVEDWSDGVSVSELIADCKADETLKGKFTDTAEGAYTGKAGAQAVATILSEIQTDSAEAKAFARIAARNVVSEKGIAASSKQTDENTNTMKYVFSNVPYGYYVAVNTAAVADPDNTAYESYTLGILKVVNTTPITGSTKIDFPSFDKQIGDINDSDATSKITYNEAADHDIGDEVPFRLVATVPTNIDAYDTYKMIFHDNLQTDVFQLADNFTTNGVTVTYYPSASDFSSGTNGINVTGASVAKTTDVTWTEENIKVDANEDFTVTLNDIKSLDLRDAANEGVNVVAGGVFVVDYKATLTNEAKMGAEGNWNGAYLEYSNNPNFSGEGDTDNTGKGPKDYVVAFTYQTFVNKTNGTTDEPLTGAEFTLYKKMTNTTGLSSDDEYKQTDKEGTDVTPSDLKGYYKVVTAVKNDNGDQFAFNGLDDGNYLLVESSVPDDFNGIAPFKFSITANEVQTDGSEALDSLSGTASKTGDPAFTTGNVYKLTDGVYSNVYEDETEASKAAKGSVATTIKNYKGSELPSTGGIGTTLFYVVGGVLVVGAGVTLITKKRIGKDAK